MTKTFRIFMLTIVILTTTSCTTLVGMGIKHSLVTPPAKETYSLTATNAIVLSQVKDLLLNIGTVDSSSESSIQGTDKEKMYQYVVSVAESANPGAIRMTIDTVLVGNYLQTKGTTTTKDKSHEFIHALEQKLGVSATLLE